jgi:N-acetylmuramoyl-L-alanine amidase
MRTPAPFIALERFGYDIADGHAAVRAFQRRYRPRIIDGQVDGEIGALLFDLLVTRDSLEDDPDDAS